MDTRIGPDEPVSARVQDWAVDNMHNTTPDWSRQTIEWINLPTAEDGQKMRQKIWDKIAGELDALSKLVMAEGTLTEEGIAESDTMVNKLMQKGMEVVKICGAYKPKPNKANGDTEIPRGCPGPKRRPTKRT